MLALLAGLACAGSVLAQEGQRTLAVPVQVKLIVEADRLVASNVRLSRLDVVDLDPEERVLKRAAAAAVIVVMTNQRLLGYGPAVGWRELARLPDELPENLAAVDYAGFVTTSRRLLNFNARTGIWAAESRSGG